MVSNLAMRLWRTPTAMIVVVLAACMGTYAQAPDSSVRHIRERPGRPISDSLRADDKMVIVDSVQDGPDEITNPIRLERMTKSAAAIVVVEVVSVEGALTPQQDWIRSQVTASLVEVLKAPKAWGPNAGDLITFEQNQGEAYVGGTKVVASVPWARPIEAGKRYLIFANIAEREPRFRWGPTGTYEMGNSNLRRLGRRLDGDDIETTEPTIVLTRIRDATQ